jgi:hypothetical protein
MTKFDEFWAAYPRRVGKALCRAKFNKITGSGLRVTIEGETFTLQDDADDIIKSAKAFTQRGINGDAEQKYIPHPATWLNQGRYEDIEDDERDELAAFYDRIQGKIKERLEARKLKVVE